MVTQTIGQWASCKQRLATAITPEWFGGVYRAGGRWRAMIEPLEQRAMLSSTLFVYGGAPDATHFNTVQQALSVAVAGDTILLQSGFSAGTFVTTALTQPTAVGATSIRTAAALSVGEVVSIGSGGADSVETALVTGVTPTGAGDFQISLATPLLLAHSGSKVDANNGATGPTLGIGSAITLTADAGVVLPYNLDVWESTTGATLSSLNLGTHTLLVDGNGNTVKDSTLGQILLLAGSQNNAFVHNTITVNNGDGLSLEHSDGTVIQGNTINVSLDLAFGVVVHNSDHVVISGNVITTGSGGTGVFVVSDGTGVGGADISGNTIHTTDGNGIFLQKMDTTATLEARVQGNDLRLNAVGVFVLGDGSSAGNVDLGGGAGTQFGASSGGNDFTTFTTSDDSHFAIGLFGTSAGYTLQANDNLWGVASPTSVVADGTHTAAAGGSGVIVANVAAPAEVLTAKANNLAAVETGTTAGVVASFTSNLQHVPADFTVMIDWGDGTTSKGIVVANGKGGFDVMASHTWSDNGSFEFTVTIASTGGATVSTEGTATISQRVLTVQGMDITTNTKKPFSGTVATFTDNLGGTTGSSYVASVAWSDGVITNATVTKNADGSFSINTTRSFKMAGVIVASVAVGTVDGEFSGTANFTATVTDNGNGNGCHGRDLRKCVVFVKHCVKSNDHHGSCNGNGPDRGHWWH